MKNVKAILRKKDVESILRASGQDNIISQNQKLAENKIKTIFRIFVENIMK